MARYVVSAALASQEIKDRIQAVADKLGIKLSLLLSSLIETHLPDMEANLNRERLYGPDGQEDHGGPDGQEDGGDVSGEAEGPEENGPEEADVPDADADAEQDETEEEGLQDGEPIEEEGPGGVDA